MGGFKFAPDIHRRERIAATTPRYVNEKMHNFPFLAGPIPQNLGQNLGAIDCSMILVNSLASNLGLLYVGGSEVSIQNGVELDPGRGAIIEADAPVDGCIYAVNLRDVWVVAANLTFCHVVYITRSLQ